LNETTTVIHTVVVAFILIIDDNYVCENGDIPFYEKSDISFLVVCGFWY